MTRHLPSRRLQTLGQGAVEYILIVGLISLLIFLAVKYLGQNINQAFDKAADDMGAINSSATG
ncbi:MAG: Flp family type IVb pilin [Verrucomicrobiia bacterium]